MMSLPASERTELARLALVASDAAYAGDQARAGAPLAPFVDRDPTPPPFTWRTGFVARASIDDSDTGLKVVLFNNDATNELIVAFAGTDGLSPVDWSANTFHLGMNQWHDANKTRVLSAILQYANSSTVVHLTGQSLGGALAQYAARDLFADGRFLGRATLTTFNSLGGIAALRDRDGIAPTVDPRLEQIAHYRIANDLVSRLGEGHLGGNVYQFDFRDFKRYNSQGQRPFYDLVDAHRIESGFYANLGLVQSDFDRAIAVTPEDVGYLQIPTLQKLASKWGNPLQSHTTNPLQATLALIGSLGPAIADAPASEVNEAARAIYDHRLLSGGISESMWERSRGFDFAGAGKRIHAMQPAVFQGSRALAMLIDIAMRIGGGDLTFVPPLLNPKLSQQLNTLPPRTDPDASAQWEVMEDFLLGSGVLQGASLQSAIQPEQLAASLMSGEHWLEETQELLEGASGLTGSALAHFSTSVARILANAVLAHRDQGEHYAEYASTGMADVLALVVDGGRQIARANPDYVGTALAAADSGRYGVLSDFTSYDAVRDALASALDDEANGVIASAVRAALTNVEAAGQRVVLSRAGTGNPFDQVDFEQADATLAVSHREGATTALNVCLPYAADFAGQDVALSLRGVGADQFTITQDGVPLQRHPGGGFVVQIEEQRRQATVVLRAAGDIDVDSTITLAATIVDDSGTPSHRPHDEVIVALDAIVEPATNPANAVSGTSQDDNRLGDAQHYSVSGAAAADHIRLLAGRDEGFGAGGDDLMEGGPGADIVRGNDGDDRIFADAAMDEATLRSYIASSAAVVDNSDAPAVTSATTIDWLVGELGEDTIVGTGAVDAMFGGGGSDLLVGGAGHDILHGDAAYVPTSLTGVTLTRNYGGNPHEILYSTIVPGSPHYYDVGAADVIHAGSGDDVAFGGRGQDTIFGDEGDDILAGAEDDDSLFGGAGDDHIAGGIHGIQTTPRPSGDDYIDGGAGNDLLQGESGGDVLIGGEGDDVLQGFIGTTFIGGYNEDPASDGNDHLSGGAGADELVGYAGDDTLIGGDDNDFLFGDDASTPLALRGNDSLDGGAGDDYLRGYEGNDELLGGWGEDELVADGGDDHLDGGTEDDRLFGMDGDDVLLGDGGKDQMAGGEGNDRVDGGVDDDQIWGEGGEDELAGGSGNDYIQAGDGADKVSGGADADLVYAGAGDDLVTAGGEADQVMGGAGRDDISGDAGDDQIWGEADGDKLAGGADNDHLAGGDGNDELDGGTGEDVVFGEAGDDVLYGGAGRDYLLGGAGNDVYLIDGTSSEDVIIDDEGQNTLRFADGVRADELRYRQGIDPAGNDRYLVIEGGATLSRVVVRAGMDGAIQNFEFHDGTSITHAQVLADLAAQAAPSKKPITPAASPTVRYGTEANDVMAGLGGNDSIHANAGDDVVDGGTGHDHLEGGTGADRLDGGADNDRLKGGPGNDTFVFGRDRARDVIEEEFVSQTGATEIDTVELAAGVAPGDVTLHRDGGDLVLAINQTGAQLRVHNHFVTTKHVFNPVAGRNEDWPADRRIERIRFSDATIWDAAAIAARTVAGTPNTLTGTAGNDTFTVDDAADVVNEAAGAGTADAINASVSYALRRNVERLTLTGFVDTNAWSTPGNAVSHLTGNIGNNVFNGPGTYYDANGLPVTSASGGTMGYAVMAGGAGDDTYHLRDTTGGQVVEAAGQGRDAVVLNGVNWTSYTLPDHVEVLLSAEGGAGVLGSVRYRTGNALDNTIEGSTLGLSGAFANIIDGGAGADTLIGFQGNDRYIVDNARDVLIDKGVTLSGAQLSTGDEAWSSVTYELPDNIESLVLTGSGAIDGYGNDLGNMLDGSQNAAINRLTGDAGNDWYKAGANDAVHERHGEGVDTVQWHGTGTRVYTAADLPDNVEGLAFGDDLGASGYVGDGRMDRVTGNASMNVIEGGAGDDALHGGGGSDTLTGGLGNDTLSGGTGYDVMHFSRGFGQDLIWNDIDYEIRFDSTIAVSDLSMVDGELRIQGTTDVIDVVSAPAVRFADGTFYSSAEMGAMLLASGSTTPTPSSDMLRGTSAADTLDGLDGDDFIYGADGDDTLIGGLGRDRLYGDNGHDTLRGDEGNDTLEGGNGNDHLRGAAGQDTLHGGEGGDDLDGGPNDDFAYGGAGNDELAGGGGWDALRGGDGDDVLTLAAGTGYAAGEEGNDRLTGGATFDVLEGGAGDDRLDGGPADDNLDGGAGIDTYVLTRGQGLDQLIDPVVAAELTIIEAGADIAPADVELSRTQDEYGTPSMRIVIARTGDGFDMPHYGAADRPVEIRFSDATVWTPAMVMDRMSRVDGTDADDTLVGTPLDDRLFGLAGNDTLTALAGDDHLDGGTGGDWMEGGEGNDSYVVDTVTDTVVELPGEGVDSVESALSLTLASDVENLTLVGAAVSGTGNAVGNRITGNALANTLDGRQGADTLIGGAGNDAYVVDSALDSVVENAGEGTDTVSSSATYTLGADVEHLTLTGSSAVHGTGNALGNALRGNSAPNTLTALDGNDTIDGGAGADQMRGGRGDDVYTIDHASDAITELAGEGVDRVNSSVSHTLSAEVEHLTLTGSAAVNATGNALANQLTGNGGANVLDGKAGADTLRGGLGNDTYVVDAAADALFENANEGTDTVQASLAWTLAANFENLTLTGTAAINGTGNALANTLQGNSGANVLNGGAGNDTLRGGAGNDTYVVDSASDVVTENASEGTDLVNASVSFALAANVENLTLTGAAAINATGNALANVLLGNAAENTLNGGAGNDTMRGGAGDDTYVVDATTDIVVENASEGTDTVQSAIAWTLGANVERLTLTGAAAINGTGNALANTLQGNAAANTLNGGAGNDTLRGGAGNDNLVVDSTGDVVVENAGEGDDTVQSSVAWTLGANLENVTLIGAAAVNATGNTLGNWLQGNGAINTLDGGDGNDLLFGAAGNDTLAGGNGRDLLQGGDGNDTIGDIAGNNLLHGAPGTDALTGGANNELFAGGAGNDTITTGAGADIVAFNRGDGQDVVSASTGADDTLSLGGGIRYADLALLKSGNDLIVEVGASEQLTFRDWYLTASNRNVVNLQMVVDASTDFNAGSTNPLYNKRVARFDFSGLVTRYDAARAADPLLTRWSVASALTDVHLGGGDTAALGGDLGYQYGRNGTFAGISWNAADPVLASASFGTALQTLQAPATLFAGGKTLQ